MVEYLSKDIVEGKEVGSDPELEAAEKETNLTVNNDSEKVRIHTNIPVHIRWLMSIGSGELVNFRLVNDTLVSVIADVPKGHIKLQGTNRQSQTNGAMVTYGDNE